MTMRFGIDLGGTKIEILALDDGGVIRWRRRVPTPRGDYQATVAAIAGLVGSAEREIGAQGSVGIAMPGVLSPATGLVKNANSTCLNGRPFDRDMMAALGRPARFANDADCFTLSEAADGAAKDCPTVFGVILGTGVGGGIVVAGQLVQGPNAIAGEWGHNPLPWPNPAELPGPACYCGRLGCIETFLSGPALEADYARSGRPPRDAARIAALTGTDAAAEVALARYEGRLARALAHVINILDPHVIVLGGGLSEIGRLYRTVPALWGELIFSDLVATRLVKARHGPASGARGAARLWPAGGHDDA